MAQNYYQLLGIAPKATSEEIQASYRALAAQVYPGVNRGEAEATSKMKEINRAYETLRNAEKRRVYDETLSPASRPAPRQAETPRESSSGGAGASSGVFSDAFNSMRGQARENLTGAKAPAPAGNAGPVVEIWITSREAVEGTEKLIRVDGKPIRLKIGIRR